jgi:hypothetical protein
VLDELSQDNLRRFLRYITGMVAIPIEVRTSSLFLPFLYHQVNFLPHFDLEKQTYQTQQGIGKPIVVQCQSKSEHLPSAHTCSFQLDMPDYNSLDVTRKKILKMLEWLDSGFAFV